MPVVTIQLGQCGNQLGASWFDTLAEELLTGGYGQHAADTYFQQLVDNPAGTASSKQWSARAVMVDMEPKVIYSAKQRALSSPHGWRYAAASAVSGQSGSGNNWALGHNKYGPMMAPSVSDLVRKQVEACDVFEGFLMLQSMAGGTGAGAGTFLSEALVDEYSSAHMLNCCVWPYSSGEVTVQPYNTLLSLATLSQVSSGILLMQNEVLHDTCTRLLGHKQPGFKELNTLAARGLASVLLPCRHRSVTPQPSSATAATSASRNSRQPPAAGRPTSAGRTSTNLNGSGSNLRWSQQLPGTARSDSSEGGFTALAQMPFHPLGDLCCHLFSHPSFQLASLRALPQLPSTSVDFTTFSWPAVLRRLKAMSLAGVYLDEGLSSFMPGTSSAALPLHRYKNKSASSLLMLRGSEADTIAVSELADPNMFASWCVDPLLVAGHSAKFAGCQLAASLLSTDQAGVAPLHPMQCKAYSMLSARAYLHQYEAYGLGQADFEQCFAVVEEIKAGYASLG